MSTVSNKMIGTFASKPETGRFFEIIEDDVNSLGECKKKIKA